MKGLIFVSKNEKRLLDEIMPSMEIKDEDVAELKQLIEDLQNHKYTKEELDAMIEEERKNGLKHHTEEEIREMERTGHDKDGHYLTSTYHPITKKKKLSD